jgi:hypothetical protein
MLIGKYIYFLMEIIRKTRGVIRKSSGILSNINPAYLNFNVLPVTAL